jgi:hypothetical protein
MNSQVDNQFGQFRSFVDNPHVTRFGYPACILILPFLREHEVVFGFNARDVYVYDDRTFAVNKFSFSINGDDVRRVDVTKHRSSPSFKTTVMNTEAGTNHYQCVVKPALKQLFPNGKIVRMGRGPGLSTKEKGSVKKKLATHFDIYVRH